MKSSMLLAALLCSGLPVAHARASEAGFPAGPRPDHPQLVQRGELQPDDPVYVQLLGDPAPAGKARPLRFEQAQPFELAPPTAEQWQRHREQGGMLFPDDPRPPRGQGRPGATRVNFVYCGWVLHQGKTVPGDLAYRYAYRQGADGEGGWQPSGMDWRRLEVEELQGCRGDAAP